MHAPRQARIEVTDTGRWRLTNYLGVTVAELPPRELRGITGEDLGGRQVGVGTLTVRTVMDDAPLTCTPETEMDEVRRMMLLRHARYMPVLDRRTLMGEVSFYDVAKAVVDAQDFENRMLKAYIRDWPAEG